jgi:hypothetical protein
MLLVEFSVLHMSKKINKKWLASVHILAKAYEILDA